MTVPPEYLAAFREEVARLQFRVELEGLREEFRRAYLAREVERVMVDALRGVVLSADPGPHVHATWSDAK